MNWRILFIGVALVVAGCGAADTPATNTTDPTATQGTAATVDTKTSTQTPTSTVTDKPALKNTSKSETSTQTSTPTVTATERPTISVGVGQADNLSLARSHVEQAIASWNESPRVSETLELVSPGEEPDISISYQTTIQTCAGEVADNTFYWCYDDDVVRVADRYMPSQVVELTERGLGAKLGVDPIETSEPYDEIEPQYKSPFFDDTVSVALVNRDGDVTSRQRTALRDTLAYWNEHAPEYGDWSATFVRVEAAENADITVAMVEDIQRCADAGDALGCAPILKADDVAASSETVQIESGYTLSNTTTLMKHEFGHVLGLEHGEEPMPLMGEYQATYLAENVQNLNTRAYGFESSVLEIYVDYGSFDSASQSTIRDEVISVMEWYEDGGYDGAPDDLRFTFTDERDAAQIVVQRNASLVDEYYYWIQPYTYDIDRDPAAEYYSQVVVELPAGDSERFAYSLAKGMGYPIAVAASFEDAPPTGIARYEREEWPNG